MAPGPVAAAFRAEAERLSGAAAAADEAAFARPSRCPPWTVGELLYHVRMTVGRVPLMLDQPEPARRELVSAAGYYRPGRASRPRSMRNGSPPRGAEQLTSAAAGRSRRTSLGPGARR